MVASGDFPGEQIYSMGRVIIDESFHTQSADEAFFSYFGNDVIYSIRRTIDDTDFPRIKDCIDSVSSGERRRTVIRVKGMNGDFRWALASVRNVDIGGGAASFEIALSDIFSLESLAYGKQQQVSDYRCTLSLISLSIALRPSVYGFICAIRAAT